MTRETTSGVGRWREGTPSRPGNSRTRLAAKKWLGGAILSALLLFTVGTVGWLLYQFIFPERFEADFVPLMISDYQKPAVPPLPWATADRKAIQQAKVFTENVPNAPADEGLTLEVARERLKKLQQKNSEDAVVVYIEAHALVERSGAVQILMADSDPYVTKLLLPLSYVLTSLKECPAKRKLLVLDIMSRAFDPLELGGTSDGVADVIRTQFSRADGTIQPDDPNLFVLLACGPGEAALSSEALDRQSVFGHYFQRAFSDREADADADAGPLTVKELAAYLSHNVDHWARQHRGVRQRPFLIGKAQDFPLAPIYPERLKTTPKSSFSEKTVGQDKPDAKEKTAEKQKAGDTAKAGEIAKKAGEEPAKNTEKVREEAHESEERVYPKWLTDFWKTRDEWLQSGSFAAAPRVFRRLETTLLRAEQEWRSGKEPEELEKSLNMKVGELTAEMVRAQDIKHPPVHSVGQARALGRQADPALVKTLTEILEKRRKPEPFAPPEKVEQQLADSVKAFLAALKNGKTPLDLGAAIFEAADDEPFDAKTVTFLDSLVSQSKMPFEVVELRLLRQLADRATQAADWDAETMKMIWETAALAEEVNNRPLTLLWARAPLDDADRARHNASVLLLPKAAGFVSQKQIADSWSETKALYESLASFQQKVRGAQDLLDRARAALVVYVPYLEAARRGEREDSLWLEAAKAAQELDGRLMKPGPSSNAPSLTSDRLKQLGNELTDPVQRLGSRLKELLRPFQADALQAIALKSRVNIPDPGLASDIEAIMATPFPTAEERSKLWSISLALDKRLGEIDRDSEPANDTGPGPDRAQLVRDVVERRMNRLSALMTLAGVKSTAKGATASKVAPKLDSSTAFDGGSNAEPDVSDVVRLWSGLAGFCEDVHRAIVDRGNQSDGLDSEDRPGWIARAFTLDLTRNPIRQFRESDSNSARAWLADHYRHESLDLHELVDSDNFFAKAELECPRTDEAEPALEMSLSESFAAGPSLSTTNNKAEVTISLLLSGLDAPASHVVSVKPLGLADGRLRIALIEPSDKLELVPQSRSLARFRVEWFESDERETAPPPKGFIVQARLANQRAYHLFVPVTVDAKTSRPVLVLRTDPAQPNNVPFDRLLVRALPVRQKYFVIVRNPTSRSFDVIVDVMAGSKVIASSEPKPLKVAGASEAVVTSFVAPAPAAPAAPSAPSAPPPPPPKDTDPLLEAPQDLKLRLRDAMADAVYETQSLHPTIAAPLEYVEVIQPQFIPARPGEPNRLEVTVRSLPQMTLPPCQVTLIVPSDKDIFPAFVEPPKEGTFGGKLEPGGKKLELKAKDIKLNPLVETDEGRFQLTIDGLDRVLWYKTQFLPLGGETQIATIVDPPRVRFKHQLEVKPGQNSMLHVWFTVDNAPVGATLSFRLGQNKNGKFVEEMTPLNVTPKQQHIGFDPIGPDGALKFEASVVDWASHLDVPPIRGRKRLEARLIDRSTGKVHDEWDSEVVLDNLPPQGANFVEFPKKLAKGTSQLAVKATVKVPESDIKEVAFILGPKADFDKPDAKFVQGKPQGSDRSTWDGMLTLPKDATGKVVVSAKFTSGVGLTALVSDEAEIDEPVPSPNEAVAAKLAPEKPGGIEGKVTENDIIQRGVDVTLWDPEAKDKESQFKKKVTTKSDGTYAFTDLKPGRYRVFCKKDATGRQAAPDVTVPSGETVKQDLDLLLP
jgi:Carboxypeptidase regulatory-like domain